MAKDNSEVARLTGRFYTVIPHTFGRARPPMIDTLEKVQAKFEMCDVLSDIETAQVRPLFPTITEPAVRGAGKLMLSRMLPMHH